MTVPTDDQTLTSERPTVTIQDRTYTLRGLGVRDTFAVGRIVSRGAAIALQEGQDLTNATPEQWMMLFLVGMPYAEDESMKLVASLLNVTLDELDNPDAFPADTLVQVGKALWDHQDVKAFFGSVRHLAGMSRMGTPSPAQSAS